LRKSTRRQGDAIPSAATPYGHCMPELPLPTPPLADDVVALRPWRATDVQAQLAAFSDPFFQRFSDWAPRTEADARRTLVEQEEARRRGEQLELAVVGCRDHDVVLGGGSLNGVDLSQGRAAVGYWLAREARGRGLATRSVRLLARWAFEGLDLARLELTCGPDNRASQRVAVRCGFTREGVLRSHMPFKGGRRDTVLFSLLPGEVR
jgi:RimJ/RimL family protein N-acetyltransferase